MIVMVAMVIDLLVICGLLVRDLSQCFDKIGNAERSDKGIDVDEV
jgi:ABC-type thiamin/hydroxymethylpyrimidine transport system permease subunit